VRPFNILVTNDTAMPVVYLHDTVGQSWSGEDNSSQAWVAALGAITADTIQVRINSLGGDAWDGISIYNTLKDHPATIHVVIDGMAASAASVIAMSGDTITMRTGGQMMIHDASAGCWGDAAAMRKTAEMLDACSDSIAAIYATRAGGTVAEWRARMQEETWLTVEQAIALGLADTEDTTEQDPAGTTASNSFAAGSASTPVPGTTPMNMKGDIMSDVLKDLLTRLALPEDATSADALAAIDALTAPDPAPFTAPEGTQLVDSAALVALQEQAQQGVEAFAQISATRRDQIVATAVKEGRVAPVASTTWRARLDADEQGTVELLNTLAPGTAVPVAEIGHQTITGTAGDSLYDALFSKEA